MKFFQVPPTECDLAFFKPSWPQGALEDVSFLDFVFTLGSFFLHRDLHGAWHVVVVKGLLK